VYHSTATNYAAACLPPENYLYQIKLSITSASVLKSYRAADFLAYTSTGHLQHYRRLPSTKNMTGKVIVLASWDLPLGLLANLQVQRSVDITITTGQQQCTANKN
jgi:hypothetical protein